MTAGLPRIRRSNYIERVAKALFPETAGARAVIAADRPLSELIEHLDSAHHQLLRSALFKTAVLLDDALARYQEASVASLRHEFRIFSERLIEHIELEEFVLLPIATAMESALSNGEARAEDREAVKRTVRDLLLEHSTITADGDALVVGCDPLRRIADEECREIVNNIARITRRLRDYFAFEVSVLFPRIISLSLP